MKFILFYALAVLMASTLVAGCTTRGRVVVKERFSLRGKCNERNLLGGVACGCFVLAKTGQLSSATAALCRRLFDTSPLLLWRKCPRRFVKRRHLDFAFRSEAKLFHCLVLRRLWRYLISRANICFQPFATSSREEVKEDISRAEQLPSEVDEDSDKSEDYKVPDEVISLFRQSSAQILGAVEKCVKCLNCIKFNLCISV